MLTLTPWSELGGVRSRYWRLPDGRDKIAVRLYRYPRYWLAVFHDPDGRAQSPINWPSVGVRQAKSNADIELDRIRREWEGGVR